MAAERLERERMVPPLGPLQLAADLESDGYEKVRVIDVGGDKLDLEPLMEAQAILLSATTPQYLEAREICRAVLQERGKKGLEYPTLAVGGAHATYMGSLLLKDGWDYVCVGEGDLVVTPLVEGRVASGLVLGGQVGDLNTLPMPAYHRIDISQYRRSQEHKPTIPIMTSKGCPHDCSFCSNEVWGRRVRFYKPDYVVGLIKKITQLGVEQVVFYDDDALINPGERLQRICKGIEPLDVTWRCNTHVNTIVNPRAQNLGVLEMVRDAGCRHISLGIDGVDDESLSYLRKGTTVARCKEAVRLVKEAGSYVKVFLIYIPRRGDIYAQKMIDFVKDTDPDFVQVSVLIPMPGSDMYSHPGEYGLNFRKSEVDRFYYCGPKGVSGDIGMLDEEDHHAIDYLYRWLSDWRESKPEMPI